MKNRIITTVVALVSTFALYAQEKTVFMDPFHSFSAWFKNSACQRYDGGGTFKIVPDGKNGKYLQVITNEKQIFMMNLKDGFKVEDGSNLKVVFQGRGNGSLQFVFVGQAKPTAIYFTSPKLNIDSQSWKEYSFTINFPKQAEKSFKSAVLRVNVNQKSNICIDDLKIVKLAE